jgi:hypothetical protein
MLLEIKVIFNKMESEKDIVFKKYNRLTNMSYSALSNWADNSCSKKASIGRTAINRNLRLKSKSKNEWTSRDVKDAKKAISYLSRATKIKSHKKIKSCGYTHNQIALKNWAFDVKK